MDLILSECEKRKMRVWLLDDKQFPTGYANGLLAQKYPERRKWELIERHVDVIGPMSQASILARPGSEEEPLVGIYAFRRSTVDENLTGKPIDLTDHLKGGYLYWDIPRGCYRIFFCYKSRRGGRKDYIDMISEESVAVLLEAVYQPHFDHYARYFGNTFAGFFSDEPEFGNEYAGNFRHDYGLYEKFIGKDGQALPYNENLLALMSEELGEDARPYLGELWYESQHSPDTRLAYMNAATRLYRDCFSRQIGNWCRAHQVEYIGHVIEDMNAHTRLGHGAGHYFRALEGQDMGGIDIVLHQVMPGMAHYMTAAIGAGGMVDGEFFHYVLPKLASSIACQQPHMKGRAMCEVFGAYGWGEGSTLMKWLIDFLLVRGINYFVPHAFSPDYPDGDCPPHFGAEGHDPQFDGFSALMHYTNQAAHLLSGGKHQADCAILYHAEGEWMSHYPQAMLTQTPARLLYDSHIDFDIVCADILFEKAFVSHNLLQIEGQSYRALLIPYAQRLPASLLSLLEKFRTAGLPVLFVGGLPEGATGDFVEPKQLVETLSTKIAYDLTVEGDFPLLRIFHTVREGTSIFMLFNEAFDQNADTILHLPAIGSFTRLRLLEDTVWGDYTKDGKVSISLLPGQSEILVFDPEVHLPTAPVLSTSHPITPNYQIEIADSDNLESFRFYCQTNQLFSITDAHRIPDFSGKIRYSFSLELSKKAKHTVIHFGNVGQTAKLWVNGQEIGIRICPPYQFSLSDVLQVGKNEFLLEVANTLVGKQRDPFSYFLQISPTGLLGPVTLLTD
jgi:hypothetical protein